MTKNVTKVQILAELQKMAKLNKANRRPSKAIGIDTLAITFGVPLPQVINLLTVLEAQGVLTMDRPSSVTLPNVRNQRRMAGTVTLIESLY